MRKEEIKEKVFDLWDLCQDRNIGSNEAELDFKESITDFIQSLTEQDQRKEMDAKWEELRNSGLDTKLESWEQEQPKQSLDNAVDEAVNSMEFKGMLEQVYSDEQPKQSVEEFEYKLRNIIYLKLLNGIDEKGYSIPCKVRTDLENDLVRVLIKEYTQTQSTVSDEEIEDYIELTMKSFEGHDARYIVDIGELIKNQMRLTAKWMRNKLNKSE